MVTPKNTLGLIDKLKDSYGPDLMVLTDKTSTQFQEYNKRWSEIGREIPAVILLPTSEEQIQNAVQWAVHNSVPFVTKSGGHSHWSTIGDDGVIIDLSRYSGIEVDVKGQVATLKGSILTKQVATSLADVGLFTALGNGNSIGAIPYFLGGGASTTSSITGFGSDQILAARMIDAQGRLLEVDNKNNPSLLWALRGAGQFFGLVTQLSIRAYPSSNLGNDIGALWVGSFVFSIENANEVASAMTTVVGNSNRATSGMLMIAATPPERKPFIVISARYLGNPDEADVSFKPLHDINPLSVKGQPIPIQNSNDAHAFIEIKGDYKRYGVVGLRRFDETAWLKTIEIWKDLIKECPDAINTSFNFQWDSRYPKQPAFDSAMSLHDIRFWQNNLLWYSDASNQQVVEHYNDRSIEVMRGPDQSEYADFQNGTRTGPIERRFRPQSKLDKLKKLKEHWDPTGVFTAQLL